VVVFFFFPSKKKEELELVAGYHAADAGPPMPSSTPPKTPVQP
jgi:hypothetical protein